MHRTHIKKISLTLFFIFLFALPALPVRAQTPPPIVHAIMFWMKGCPHCDDVIQNVLPPLQQKYGAQFDLLLVEVNGLADVDRLYRIAASYQISKEETGVPFLVIGEQILVGSDQITDQLAALIDDHLQRGGVGFSTNPLLVDVVPTLFSAAPPSPSLPVVTSSPTSTTIFPEGGILASVVFIGMIAALLFLLIRLLSGNVPLPANGLGAAIPWLAFSGLLVAAYLSYVETQSLPAFCGPVGDCNTVQSSSYARLWGVLPIGVLGVLGYLGIFAAWGVGRQRWGRLSAYAPSVLAGMALFGTIFSIYLTYLEIFVIKAVCLWCVTSAVIITLVLLFSLSFKKS